MIVKKLAFVVAMMTIFQSALAIESSVEEDVAKGFSIEEIVAAASARGEEPRRIAGKIISEAHKRTEHASRLQHNGYANTLRIRDSLVANGVAAAEAEAIIAKAGLRGMCMYVGDRQKLQEAIRGVDGRTYVWRYQTKLFEAALVDVSKDDEDAIARKVSSTWKAHEDMLTCNNTRFDVIDGSLIKYAVNMKFDEFLLDMAAWNVDLNRVDEFDKRTVLDYVVHQMERMKGMPSEIILKRYHQVLRDAGAKYMREL